MMERRWVACRHAPPGEWKMCIDCLGSEIAAAEERILQEWRAVEKEKHEQPIPPRPTG